MDLIISLLQQMCVYLMLAYMLSKTPLFLPLFSVTNRLSHKFSIYVLFSSFCILGTYFGLQIDDAIANTRAIGAVMGGLFGGPVVGFAVGFTGGMHRYTLGGFTDVACAISTTAEGVIGGIMHLYFLQKGRKEQLFNPMVVFYVTFVAEVVQMLIILIVAKPFDQAYTLVSNIAAPMIIANSVGAALFMSILQDRKTIFEEYSATFSRRALNIAERSVGILVHGFNSNNASKIARIIYEETNVGAVAITDREKILAFVGIGADHHKLNRPISSQSTLDSMNNNDIIYLDGKENPYQCSISKDCKLGSALIIPLRTGDEVIGTIKLYEPKRKLFSTINMSMAEGIAQLLSSQILHGDYIHKQTLLNQAEIKLLHAQVNPHFLFNALNTISAITRRDPDKARSLIQHLSQFFRSNLKQNIETVTLKEELAHVNAYLTIEKARFTDRLEVDIDISPDLLEQTVPSFTLQPLVENAIKHGISNLIEGGTIRIFSEPCEQGYRLTVEDNAGTYLPPEPGHQGLGMQIVDKRLSNQFGRDSALKIEVETQRHTRMSFIIPAPVNSDDKKDGYRLMTRLTALVIDDELFAREELIELLAEFEQIEVIDQASNAIEGLKKINLHKPDVVFLDIQMPQITGIELLGMLDPDTMPNVVFVTAYDQYAIQAFEDNAFDYLLKPVDPCRLGKTIKRLNKRDTTQTENFDTLAPATLDQIPCVGHNRIVIIATKDVEFAYSDLSGVHVQTATQKATSQLTLKVIEDKTSLIRCHRQFLVNVKAIKEIKLLENGLAEIITQSDHPIPVSRRYLKSLKETLGFH